MVENNLPEHPKVIIIADFNYQMVQLYDITSDSVYFITFSK